MEGRVSAKALSQNEYGATSEERWRNMISMFLEPALKSCAFATRAQIMAPICLAVAFLHGHSVIHRDIKPENIVVTNVVRVRSTNQSRFAHPHIC